MKTLLLFLTLSLSGPLLSYEVKVHVADEVGVPVSGAKTSIYFVNSRQDEQHDSLTDRNGNASASGRGTDSVGIIVEQSGHYSARLGRLNKDMDHDVEVVLPRVINPTGLYALRKYVLEFPGRDEWFDFDLEAADWVAPHGKGKVTDFRIRFHNEFRGWKPEFRKNIDELISANKRVYAARNEEWTMEKFKASAGKWDAVMEISFPGEQEGLLTERRFLKYSQLKMSHAAPADGYQPTYRRAADNYSGYYQNDDTGFFLRTRVKLDAKGSIISANYTKILGDLFPSAGGASMQLSYYFNPVPNDRNLEFDPKKNLFPKDKPGANVFEP